MKKEILIYLAFIVATISTAGSFFFSQLMNLPPCSLCWYQRIFMFPLVIVLGVGYLLKDAKIHYYSLPLIFTGWLIAGYHNLIYYKLIAVQLVPCTGGISCTERQLDLFGFLSIPLLSLVSFTFLFILMGLFYRQGIHHETR